MRKRLVLLVALVAVVALMATNPAPAQSRANFTCIEELQPVCQVVGTILCAKHPCYAVEASTVRSSRVGSARTSASPDFVCAQLIVQPTGTEIPNPICIVTAIVCPHCTSEQAPLPDSISSRSARPVA